MPTTKHRINITLSEDVEKALKGSAKKDRVPEATKAAELLKLALEIEEDTAFGILLKDRQGTPRSKYVSHEKAWKHLK